MAIYSPYFARPSVVLRRKALARTVFSGSPFWRSVAVTILVGKFLRRQVKSQPEFLTRDRVLIGQMLSVTAVEPTTRRDRRQQRRSSKAVGTES